MRSATQFMRGLIPAPAGNNSISDVTIRVVSSHVCSKKPSGNCRLRLRDKSGGASGFLGSGRSAVLPKFARPTCDWEISLEERIDHAPPTIRKSNNGVTVLKLRTSEIAAILRI